MSTMSQDAPDLTPAQAEVLRLLGERGTPQHAQDLVGHVEGLNLSGVQFALTMLEQKGLIVSAKRGGEFMPSWTLLQAGREALGG